MTTKEPTTLADQALEITRDRIVRGEYRPGSRLRLNALASETGASLIPVREALRTLEAERFVQLTPNRGATVAALSVADLNDVYAVRKRLEAVAISSARPISEDDIAELEDVLSNIALAVRSGDTDRTMALHRQFHFALYRRSDSQWMLHLIEMLWKHADRYQWMTLEQRHESADAEHRALLAALAGGDHDTAAVVLTDHLDRTRRVLEKALLPEVPT